MWDSRCRISCCHRTNDDRGSKKVIFQKSVHTNLIVLTGPESTGKTTLGEQIANHFGVQLIPEYARGYISRLSRKYQMEDLTKIAHGQNDLLHDALKTPTSPVIMDTDLLTIEIWSQFKYGRVDEAISTLLLNNLPSLYLLCDIDIPWVEDDQRENPEDRIVLRDLYQHRIEQLEVPYVLIQGNPTDRLSHATEAIRSLLPL